MHTKFTTLPPQAEAKLGPDLLLAGQRAIEGKPVGNRILVLLPQPEYHTLRPLLTSIQLPQRASVYEPGEKLEFVYFPNRGLVSLIVAMKDGKTVEVAVVGKEGLVGTAAVVGLGRNPHRAIAHSAGEGLQVRIDALRTVLPTIPTFQYIVTRHAVVQGMQAAQSAACNRLHGTEQRIARWVLIMQDRTNEASLRITHDFLATRLGTDRPSVSLAAGLLQRKGAIKYSRGVIRIVDRQRLEECACECYEVIQQLNRPLDL